MSPTKRRSSSNAALRKLVRRSFRDFVTEFWPVVEPARPMLPSVAINVIADALQATVDGDVHRLAIACPPGVSKSILCAVLYPAWILFRTGGKARIMVGSYSWTFAERDSVRCRMLVESPQYRALVGGAWSLRADRSAIADWWTTAGGRRLITSVDGKSTGERVDYQVIDDALSAADRLSDAKKREAARWVTEVLPSRLDEIPPARAVRVLVGQRLAVDDPIGVVLAGDPDGAEWAYCRLPALLAEGEAPTERRHADGRMLWRDPRAPGVPLFAGLDHAVLEKLGHPSALGPTQLACQYGQNPVDDAGATIKRTWWRFHRAPHVPANAPRPVGCDDAAPAIETPTKFSRVVIACDLTFGSAKGDFAVVQTWGANGAGRYLLRQWRRRAGLLDSVAAIKSMAREWPNAKIIVEKAANGAGAVEELAAHGVPNVIAVPALGSKKERIGMVAATIESGCAFLPLGLPALGDFVEELAGATKHDDQQDCAAYAIHELNKSGSNDWPEHRAERERAEREAARLAMPEDERPPPEPEPWTMAEKLAYFFTGRRPASMGPTMTCEKCASLPDYALPREKSGSCPRCGTGRMPCQHEWGSVPVDAGGDGRTRCRLCGAT